MYKKAVIEHFGSVRKTAEAIGTTKIAIFRWDDIIPKLRSYQIQVITEGKLKHDPKLYE